MQTHDHDQELLLLIYKICDGQGCCAGVGAGDNDAGLEKVSVCPRDSVFKETVGWVISNTGDIREQRQASGEAEQSYRDIVIVGNGMLQLRNRATIG